MAWRVWGAGFRRLGLRVQELEAVGKHLKSTAATEESISAAPKSGLLSLALVSANELKERAFQGVL